MMKKILALSAAALCALSAPVKKAIPTDTVAESSISFSGNVSLADPDQFKYRQTTFVGLDLGIFFNAAVYSSVAIDAQREENGGKISVDSIFGLVYFPAAASILRPPPTAWMAYYSADAEVSTAPGKIDVSVVGAGSLVATVYRGLIEKKSDGTIAKIVAFKDLNFDQGKLQSDATGNLNWVTWSATSGKATYEITFAVSKVVGKLNVGDATITPQSMESFVEVSGYEYAATGNYLELVLISGQSSTKATATFSATNTIISGSGDDEVFVKFSGQAVVNGKAVDVEVSGLAKDVEPTELENSYMEAQVRANSEWKSSIRQVVVKFPAGATSISYDPSMGVKAPNSSAAIIPLLFSIIMAVSLALFM